jgi:ABC-type branched-subunit amino acid transport system ATPase component
VALRRILVVAPELPRLIEKSDTMFHNAMIELRASTVMTVSLVDQNITKAVEISDHLYLLEMGRVRREGPRQAFADQLREIIRDALLGA